jgi:hypothetical protein
MSEDLPKPGSVHDLRRRWKPIKQRITADRGDHPIVIRFHRACTWLQRVEQIESGEDQDVALTCQWIAFNALYGQWDERAREPKPDRQSWRTFMDQVLAIDKGGHLESMLTEHKRLVMSILDDSYLGGYFWKDPSVARAKQTTREKRQAATWYIEKRWALVIESLLERIYLLRCQLVHGASSHGSRLNRDSLRRCITMMGLLLPAIMNAWIEAGANEDWGPMCYPPVG